MQMTDIALYYSVATGVAGAIGTFGAGLLVDRLSRRDARAYALVPAAAMVAGLPFFIAFVYVADWRASVTLLTVPVLCVSAYQAPGLALIQNSVPSSQRAFTAAVLGFIMTVFGVGIGPLLVGFVSDHAKAAYGSDSLAIGLYALIPVFILSIAANIGAARSIGRVGLGNRIAYNVPARAIT
jgi:MFS family permease